MARWKCTKSSITQPWISRFRSNFVQSLNTWHMKCCKISSSRGQRSRSQHDIMCAKIRKITNNLAEDCAILIKFCRLWSRDTWCTTNFQGQRSRSQRDCVNNVSALKLYNLGTDEMSKVRLGGNYPGAERKVTQCSRSLGQILKSQ